MHKSLLLYRMSWIQHWHHACTYTSAWDSIAVVNIYHLTLYQEPLYPVKFYSVILYSSIRIYMRFDRRLTPMTADDRRWPPMTMQWSATLYPKAIYSVILPCNTSLSHFTMWYFTLHTTSTGTNNSVQLLCAILPLSF